MEAEDSESDTHIITRFTTMDTDIITGGTTFITEAHPIGATILSTTITGTIL